MTDETVKCPSCGDEMQKLASSMHLSHSNNTCPLAYRPWTGYELKILGDVVAAAHRAGFAQAREMAAQYLDREAAAMYMIDSIRAMQPPQDGA